MQRVEIHVAGHLDKDWSLWLEGFTITYTKQDETVLTGKVRDQAALYGMIAKLRDLGVELAEVRIEPIEDGTMKEGKATGGESSAQD